jgi:hypothetical protein
MAQAAPSSLFVGNIAALVLDKSKDLIPNKHGTTLDPSHSQHLLFVAVQTLFCEIFRQVERLKHATGVLDFRLKVHAEEALFHRSAKLSLSGKNQSPVVVFCSKSSELDIHERKEGSEITTDTWNRDNKGIRIPYGLLAYFG